MRDLVLCSSGLLSKWGFHDGDIVWDWSYDARDETGLPLVIDDHETLRRLVRGYLLPAIEQEISAYDIETIHNPIRSESVNGLVIDDYADNDHIVLTPDQVVIPASVVLRTIADVDHWPQEVRERIPA